MPKSEAQKKKDKRARAKKRRLKKKLEGSAEKAQELQGRADAEGVSLSTIRSRDRRAVIKEERDDPEGLSAAKADAEEKRTAHKILFIQGMTQGATVKAGIAASGVTRSTLYEWRDTDPVFAEAWREAKSDIRDALEAEAYRRAVHGDDVPVYYRGEEIGAVRKFSDTLLIFLLKAHDPARFRDNISVEQSGPGGKPIEHTVFEGKSEDQLQKMVRDLVNEAESIVQKGSAEVGADTGADS